MKTIFKIYFSFLLLIIGTVQLSAQAKLTIQNNSIRSMTVKVMKGSGKGTLYQTVAINPNASETVYFSESGDYFTKTKAVLNGKNPVFQKGQPFGVTNDHTGYSVMTLVFSIKESSTPQVMGGREISKTEFDQN